MALARALAVEPSVLLLDETSAGLSPMLQDEVFEWVERINDDGTTVVIVEQNAAVAIAIADYGYVLESGRVVLDGDSARLRGHRDIQEFYLGQIGGERRSYRSVKQYRRSRRWYG
jgi:branched-chain amino acid transport system ATP-binding protein